jgi:hypothetical protein
MALCVASILALAAVALAKEPEDPFGGYTAGQLGVHTKMVHEYVSQGKCRQAGSLYGKLLKAPAFHAHEPLWNAVTRQQVKCVDAIIKQLAAKARPWTTLVVNRRNKQNGTLLHAAAFFGDKAIVRSLLRAGADVAAVDQEVNTPLHAALQGWHRLAMHHHGASPPSRSVALHNEVRA